MPTSAALIRLRRRNGPRLEALEPRLVPAGGWPGLLSPQAEVEGNDVLARAQNLGFVNVAEVVGQVGDSGPADVDFYSFTTSAPTRVQVAALTREAGSSLVAVLSLYAADPDTPTGYRLVLQTTGQDAGFERGLAAGTYFVAVSGEGNRYFHPQLAGSGYAGSVGGYGLRIAASAAPASPVLASSPAQGEILFQSPFEIRINLAHAPTGSTPRLTSSQDARFGNADDRAVALASAAYVHSTGEMVIRPARPLAPGVYRLTLANFALEFRIAGSEGQSALTPTADDTMATARPLGDVVGRAVLATGAIGDDPTDPRGFSASDIDLYTFRITTPGRYAVAAEVFAGRIDSSLDPAVTLFRRGPSGNLVMVASNAQTSNDTVAADGSVPLLTDAALFAALDAGEYYLAVSSGYNVVDPAATAGNSIGPYTLQVRVEPAGDGPRVVAGSIAERDTLARPPERFTVRFDAAVNLPQLAFTAYAQTAQSSTPAVYILGAGGVKYFPRLIAYDSATNQATFLMLDALANGNYELHLSGPNGLSDLSGNPLAGNDASGDFVLRFAVAGPARGTPGQPTIWTSTCAQDAATPQVLGTLFPAELQAKVRVDRPVLTGQARTSAERSDYYQITVLQEQNYLFAVSPARVGATTRKVSIWDHGVKQATLPQGNAEMARLRPGTYVVEVNWDGQDPDAVTYKLRISMLASSETAPPLTSGPAPVLRVRLVGAGADAAAPTPLPTPAVLPLPELQSALTPAGARALSNGGEPVEAFRALAASVLGGADGASGDGSLVAYAPTRQTTLRVEVPTRGAGALATLLTILTQSGGGGETSEVAATNVATPSPDLVADAEPDKGDGRELLRSAQAVVDAVLAAARNLDPLDAAFTTAQANEEPPVEQAASLFLRHEPAEVAKAGLGVRELGWGAALLGVFVGAVSAAGWRSRVVRPVLESRRRQDEPTIRV